MLKATTATAAIVSFAAAMFAPMPAMAAELLAPTTATPAASAFASGVKNGLAWQARKTVIGQTPTSDVGPPPSNTIGGGDPIYKPSANKSGVVSLIMEYANGNRFICSGSLLGDGRSIATAAHCVSDGGSNTAAGLVKTTAFFYKGDPDERTPFQTGGTAIDISDYFINAAYTGEVIDQNDIAVLRLSSAAPSNFIRYNLFEGDDLTGQQFNVAGYGTRSTVGGAQGNTAPFGARTGYLREGDNIYDYAWGDSRFQGFFTDRDGNGDNFFGKAEVQFSFISDFDNGTLAQDQSRRIANALGLGPLGNTFFNNQGVGAREVGIAGGDSGGPGYINGRLASINSYGLTFGSNFGDFDGVFNAGWGEFSGYVPVSIHRGFIKNSMVVPEPATWAMMIVGFGFIGGSIRMRRRTLLAA